MPRIVAKNRLLPLGKLRLEDLADLIEKIGEREAKDPDPRVIVGPSVGEDATVIDIGEKYLVVKTDPITFATDEIGWYLVCVNSNDLASMGAIPKWLLATILLPEKKSTKGLIDKIFQQILDACEKFNISLVGGHTEITYGLDRPILCGQMLGEAEKDKLVLSSKAQVGDDLLLSKGVAIEATSIIAREKEDFLSKRFSEEFIQRSKRFLFDPGISVLKDALTANEVGGVHAMHDPTEGGLATAINELAICSSVGVKVWRQKIHVYPECLRLCEEFNINPLGAISSGSLLISADPKESHNIIEALEGNNIPCSIIGKVLKPEEGVNIETQGVVEPLPIFQADEVAKIYR